MAMSWVLLIMTGASILYSCWAGTTEQVAAAIMTGASKAVELGLSLAGMLCLWCGLTEIMRRAGLMELLAKIMRRPLRALFREVSGDSEAMENIAANVSANLLGLGNAATPLSIKAATRIHKLSGGTGTASDALCMLIVLNAGSIQIIPATVAGVRAQAGAAAPFDILPAVWIATVASCAVGIIAAKLLSKVWRKHDNSVHIIRGAGVGTV